MIKLSGVLNPQSKALALVKAYSLTVFIPMFQW